MKLETIMEIAFKRKKVVRGGKVVKKKKCAAGFTLVGNRCVKQSASEKMTRKRAGVKSGRKSKSARVRNRKRSFRLRKRRGL